MKKALVAVDYSQTSKALVKYSFKYAERNDIDHLDFIYVWGKKKHRVDGWDPEGKTAPLTEEDLRKKFAALVEEAVKDSEGLTTPYNFIITYGIPCEEIIIRAEKENYQIILIGNRGVSDVSQFFIGSVAAKVVRHSPCSVLVYQPEKK